MCISVPAKVTSIAGNAAEVELNSSSRRVLLCVDGVAVGSWVLVYGGAAIAVLEEDAAYETRELLERMSP